MHALIVGDRGVGKSTLIQRVLAELNRPLFGYETKKRNSWKTLSAAVPSICMMQEVPTARCRKI